MPTALQSLVDRIAALPDPIAAKLRDEYLRRSNLVVSLNAGGTGESVGDVFMRTPMKYVIEPRVYLRRFYQYIPMLIGTRSFFEIGVGPGFLFKILQELLGCTISGIDINFKREWVYRDMRKALEIDRLFTEHMVKPGSDIPIPGNTEAAMAFFTVFNETWNIEDHEWFLEQCGRSLVGRRLIYLRFNPKGFADRPEIAAFYRDRATFPLQSDQSFCVLEV